MENRRFILLAFFGVMLFLLYQAWIKDYAAQPAVPAAAAPVTETPLAQTADSLPRAIPAGEATAAAPATAVTPAVTGRSVRVVTDVMDVEISLAGGDLHRLLLLRYPLSKEKAEQPLPLLNDRDAQYFVIQSGLAGTEKALVTPQTAFTAAQDEYRLAEGATTLEIPLEYQDASGYVVRKTYRFARGSYRVELEQQLANRSGQPLTVSEYARLMRTSAIAGELPKFASTFLGVGFYEQKDNGESYRFKKVPLKKLAKESFDKQQTGGWIAMLQHYFVGAILPAQDARNSFSAKPGHDGLFQAQYVGPGVEVASGAEQLYKLSLYVGPKLQSGLVDEAQRDEGWTDFFRMHGLDGIVHGFDYVVDYGILTPLAEPLFWLLEKFHRFTGNWGWSIILLTLVVKAAFYKLSEAQYRSMAKMKKFAPRIQDLKERYADDRERMSKAMMDLYKKEGFNPLAGCWPLLVQFPVFIALYWVLLESVELRQADWALWINDLTAPDPFYILPVLYGLSFFLQQKMSGQNAAMDPMQQKIMNVMPIAMTGFFVFFQSGLVLYWLMSNLIGIAQQWYIIRKLEREGLGRSP
jgi:YidC/Oxa1 family membrane protein insertase